jgi:hypothetical protein
VANGRPSIDSVTFVAPLDVHWSSTWVGAVHETGDAGVMRKSVMWTVEALPALAVVGVAVGGGVGVVVDARTPWVVWFVETRSVGVVDCVEGLEVVDLDSTDVEVVLAVGADEP